MVLAAKLLTWKDLVLLELMLTTLKTITSTTRMDTDLKNGDGSNWWNWANQVQLKSMRAQDKTSLVTESLWAQSLTHMIKMILASMSN